MLVEDRAWWGQCLKHYVAVVCDLPFVYGGKPKHPKAIKKATLKIKEVTKSLERATEGTVHIVWRLEARVCGRKETRDLQHLGVSALIARRPQFTRLENRGWRGLLKFQAGLTVIDQAWMPRPRAVPNTE
jgi:hypothetical protein